MPLFKRTRPKILFIAPEAAPFVKAGGLGEVMFALPRALRELGCDVRVMIPRYASIDLEKFDLTMEMEGLRVPTDTEETNDQAPKELICNVKKYTPPTGGNGGNRTPVITYFLENEEYYEKRSNIYGYNDDAIRWMLLSRGVLEFIRLSDTWKPEVIIASDWQTGFLCNYMKTVYKDDSKLNTIATAFIIHNLHFQGMFDHRFISEMDYDDGQASLPSFFDPRLLKMNGMRRGIIHADAIGTVSPTYAKEIMTEEYGELLEGLLKERRSRIYGIMNGIDYEEFNPEEDRLLPRTYSTGLLDDRAFNKTELQRRFGLKEDKKSFLISIASRLTEQKGFDLLFSVADILLQELPIQLVVVGAGEGKYMGFFQELENRYPGRVGTHLSFDPVLPHLVHGGSDAILIPSRFEPAGLLQLEAMRYGAIPIARKTGGLADTITNYDPITKTGTGFLFERFDSQAMMIAIVRALENFREKRIWRQIQKQAMNADFSWKRSAEEYLHLTTIATELHRRDRKKE